MRWSAKKSDFATGYILSRHAGAGNGWLVGLMKWLACTGRGVRRPVIGAKSAGGESIRG